MSALAAAGLETRSVFTPSAFRNAANCSAAAFASGRKPRTFSALPIEPPVMILGETLAAAKSFFVAATTTLSAAVVSSRNHAVSPVPSAFQPTDFTNLAASFLTASGALPASTTSARAARASPFSS